MCIGTSPSGSRLAGAGCINGEASTMTRHEAFWFGFAQGAEIVLLPFIVLYERLSGTHLGRLNE